MPTVPALAVTATIDETSLLVIVGVAALAGILTMLLAPRLTIPVVVLELLLGIIVGPEVAGIAEIDPTTDFLGDLGLGMLFFFAGYEIDFNRISGRAAEASRLRAGRSRWCSPTESAGLWRRPGWCSPTSTPGRRWRRPRSAP